MNNAVDNKLDYLLNKALDLGVENAKIIDTDTISVAEWVSWKCRYGCPFYEKDASHPPLAPKAEEMRKVLHEYDKALLLNGSHGSLLSKLSIQLEYEAVQMGYYKAFALIATSP